MIAIDQTQSWLDRHAQTAQTEPEWLLEQRQQALTRFEHKGLPGVRDEQWRYTNLRKLKSQAFELSTPTPLTLDLSESDFTRLVFVDGHFDASNSTTLAQSAVQCISLREAIVTMPELLEKALGNTLPKETHGFIELNSAFYQDGYVLHLAENTEVAQTIEVVFVSETRNQISHTRNLIVTGANSKATIIERHIGAGELVYLSNSMTEIHAGKNSQVDHYKILQESDESFHMGALFVQQSANSQVSNHNICLSGLVTRNDIAFDLLGSGAHCEMNGLVLGQGRQHIDNHTEVNHAVPHCTSDEYYKSILDDKARSVFRGRIVVAQDAQQTNADQQNNNLLLSEHSEADTKPQLEIYADDVKCSHGATVGQLDQNSLFYLQSRGINDASARALLTFAFANEVIERIKVNEVKQELTQLIAGELLTGLEDLV